MAAHEFQILNHFSSAREAMAPMARLDEVRRCARRFREAMLSGPQVEYCRSFDLIRVPYPTKYALRDACSSPTPFIHILNRMVVVRFKSPAGLKTLLFSPSDIDGNRETPFFKRLAERYAFLGLKVEHLLSVRLKTVEQCLGEIGVKPEEVDYVTYDHLHTQDLRKWLGAGGYFPNAKLLIMRQEWESTRALLPPQRDWYCPGGIDGIAPERVILLDDDVLLGAGVALMRTPGHTEGNHSLVLHADSSLYVMSENGVSADSYSPMHSQIPGVRQYAKDRGMDLVLNGNTLESSVDQYISMIQEREVAGPARDPRFFNVMPSSELSAYWLFPGVKPTFSFGELSFGALA